MSFKKNDNLSFIKIVQDYFERMLQEIIGIKCLILDEETTGIISVICSQSQILKKDVYLIEKIHKQSSEPLLHLKAIYFVRPTQENLELIKANIKNPRFSEFYLYFSNSVDNYEIEKLAELDEKDSIKQLQEVYADYYALNHELFTLNIDSCLGLTKIKQAWTEIEITQLSRIFDGIFASLLSLRRFPMIRFLTTSDACAQLAEKLTTKMKQEFNENENQFDKESRTLLLITDRREDPITPLLNQWTYQAMLHELIGLKNNRLDLGKGDHTKINVNSKDFNVNDLKEFVVSCHQDPFYNNNMFTNFGELAQNIKDFIDEMSLARQKTIKIESLDDMQRALDALPELKKMSGNVQKHVTLTTEISRLIGERLIMDVSKVEQEISSKDNRAEHFRMVLEILQNKQIQQYEKLKLVVIYALRYENDDKIEKLKELLRENGITQNSINLINYAIEYAGKNKRAGDLFSEKEFINKAKNIFKAFKDVPNVYTQHQPHIINLIDLINKGKLKESEYPTTISPANFNYRPTEIIIFMVGGATFEEAREVATLNNQAVFLGATTIHNTKTFLAEFQQINFEKKEKDQININIDSESSGGKGKGGFWKMN